MTGVAEAESESNQINLDQDCLYTSEELGGDQMDPSDGGAFNSPSEEFTPFMPESGSIPSVPDRVGRHLIGIQILESEY